MANITGNNLLDDSLSGTSGADIVQGLGGNDTLLGRGGNDSLSGGDGNDYLNGGTGVNTLAGGAGDDTYEINAATDVVIEDAGEGTDKVRTWASNYTLADNVEQLELLGTAEVGRGNALANLLQGSNAVNTLSGMDGNDVIEGRGGIDILAGDAGDDTVSGGTEDDLLYGGDGNDVLLGGAGADLMIGDGGNDQYEVDNAGDVVNEGADAGIDLVRAAVNYTLVADVENLELSGMAAKGTGNTVANAITGNAVGNILHGGGGADTIDGGDGSDRIWGDAGNDLLRGGNGTDTYQQVRGGGSDRIVDTDAGGNDVLRFGNANVAWDQLWFTQSGNDLLVRVLGASGYTRIDGYFTATDHGWQVLLGNGLDLVRSQVDSLVTAMASLSVPSATAIPSTGGYAVVRSLADALWHDSAPTDITLDNASVAENSAAGTAVGLLSASDPDAGDSHTYSLIDDAGGRFEIVGSELRVATGAVLDYEASAAHVVTVRATDAGGLSFDKDLAINLTDVAEGGITGTEGNDTILGTGGNDLIMALGGADEIAGDEGDDTIDGGAGGDTAFFSGGIDQYMVFGSHSGQMQVTTTLTDQGNDVLRNVEDVVFSGGGSVTSAGAIDWRVNTQSALSQEAPAIAALADGSYVVVWTSGEAADYDVHGRVYRADGTAVGDEFVVAATAGYYENDATVAALAGGGFVVGWADNVSDGSSWSCLARVYDADGVALGSAIVVDELASGPQGEIALAGTADGGFAAVWTDQSVDGAGNIMGRVFDAAGTALFAPGEVATTNAGEQAQPAVTSLANGNLLVTWQTAEPGGSGYRDITARLFNAAGEPQGAQFALSDEAWVDEIQPQVAALTGGGFVAVWNPTNPLDGLGDVRIRLFDAGGTAAGPSFLAHADDGFQRVRPTVAALTDGGFVVTWTSYGQDGSAGGIFAQRYDASGSPVDGEVQVNIYTDQDQVYSAVTGMNDGGYAIAWQTSEHYEASGNVYDINLQRYVTSGITVADGLVFTAGSAGHAVVMTGQDDRFAGGEGNDSVQAAAGDDVLAGNGGDDTLDGGDHHDTAQWAFQQANYAVSAAGGVLLSVIDTNTLDGDEGTDTLASVEVLGFANDVLVTAWGADGISVQGSDYEDLLTGSAGNDRIEAAENIGAADTILGDGGNDTVHGGGEDTVRYPGLLMNTFVHATGPDSWQVVDASPGGANTGTDSIRGVGRIELADAAYTRNPLVDDVHVSLTAGVNTYAGVTSLAGGGYVVVWAGNPADGDDFGAMARVFDAAGNPLTGEIAVNQYTAWGQTDTQACALADGGFLVTWTSYLQDGDQSGVIARRFDADGVAVGNEFVVNVTTASSQANATATSLADGSLVICWQSESGSGSVFDVVARRFAADGTPLGGEFVVNTQLADVQGEPVISALSTGGFVIAWTSYAQDVGEPYGGIYARVYDALGTPQGGEILVNEVILGDQAAPAIAASASGFVVAWMSIQPDNTSYYDIHARRFDSAGVALDSEFTVVADAIHPSQANPSVAMSANGSFIVTWDTMDEVAGLRTLYAQTYLPSGQSYVPPVQISTDAVIDHYWSSATALADGSYAVAWSACDVTSAQTAIYSQVVNADGSVRGATFRELAGDNGDNLVNNVLGVAESILGLDGNDTLTGDLQDSLSGGNGNDVIDVANFSFYAVDGGAGTDTLVLRFADVMLDLTHLPDGRLTGIERIDLGTQAQTLVLNLDEVLNISVESDTLAVFGDAADTVHTGSGWTAAGTETVDGHLCTRYEQSTAVLLVEQVINVV